MYIYTFNKYLISFLNVYTKFLFRKSRYYNALPKKSNSFRKCRVITLLIFHPDSGDKNTI